MELRITESRRQQKREYGKQLSGILLETALIGLSVGGGLLLFVGALTEQERVAPILGSVFLMALFCAVTERMAGYGFYGRVGLGVIFAAGIFLLHSQLLNGLALYWNDMAEILGSRAGTYLNRFETGGIQNADTARLIFLLYLGMAAGVCGFLVLKWRAWILVLAWALVLPVLSGILDVEPDARTGAAFYLGVFLELAFVLSRSSRKQKRREVTVHGVNCNGSKSIPDRLRRWDFDCMSRDFGQNQAKTPRGTVPCEQQRRESSRAFLTGSVLAVGLSLIGGMFLVQLMPAEDYTSSELVTGAKKEAQDGISRLRYKKGEINSLPDGKLKECGAWSASDDTALSVTMENPDSLYLRGFVGSVYDGSSWESLDTEEVYNQKNLFYWLHQDGFYGETQLSSARSLVEDDTLSDQVSAVAVKNEKADSRYLYTPYEMTELPSGYDGETSLADSTLKGAGLFGCRNYSFKTNGNLVKDFTVLGARIYQAFSGREDSGAEENSYRENESYYNAFVYEQDTALSGALETLFRRELGDGGNREQGHTDYYTAISRIRSYLEKNMTYSTVTDLYTEKGDFTENFLTKSKIGHSVHYATAAALMFRYYGIPSRYVEGYLITPQDIENKNPGDTIEIPGKNGHAWTEIYIDGLGWVPVEMTPEYYDVMEEADLTAGLEAKGAKTAAVPEAQEEPPAEENIQTHWSLKLALFGIEKLLILLLAVFDLFCLLFILAVTVLRIRANRKRKKLFESEDDRQAVRAMAGYARQLYHHGPEIYSDEAFARYQKTSQVGEKAAFSPHAVSKEERKDTALCVRAMKTELKKSRSWYGNWIMKYIERLY